VAEPDGIEPAAEARLRRLPSVIDVATTASKEALRSAFATHDAIWLRLSLPVPADAVPPNPRCRILACPATGLDHIDEGACRSAGIRVMSLRGETELLRGVRATAEHTVALTLALLRRIPAAHSAACGGRWDRARHRGGEIAGRAIGLVGFGRLGRLAAELFRAFGATVAAYDPAWTPARGVARAENLAALAATSDVVSVHASFRAGEAPIIDAAFFAALRPGAFLVNTARGGLIDEAALLAALRGGRLAGAALDVVADEYGFGPASPLAAYAREHENLILTPHVGGFTQESVTRVEEWLAERLAHALGEAQPV
jgi:D-3-phosphoglycerate dehydrogenase